MMTVVFWASTVIKRTWWECLSAEDADLVALNVRIDDDDDDDGMDIDEFNPLNLTGGDDTIADEDLFVLAKEEEELNVFDGSANVPS